MTPFDRLHLAEFYGKRGAALRRLGFNSYESYLDSSFWRAIRKRVLVNARHRCVLCGKGAEHIHHQFYSLENMDGTSLEGLHALCGDCHVVVEFCDGEKVGPAEMAARFLALLTKKKTVPAAGSMRLSPANSAGFPMEGVAPLSTPEQQKAFKRAGDCRRSPGPSFIAYFRRLSRKLHRTKV